MANQIPLSGASNAAGGYLLPPEQGEILVNGILVETGVFQLAGDKRSTKSRKTNFPIWLGRPTAGPVGEGARKGVTGASFGQTTLDVKKFASIVIFTDEQIEDLQNGDLNVLTDAGVRQALSVSIDAHSAGLSGGAYLGGTGSVFNTPLLQNAGPGVLIATESEARKQGNAVQVAVSAGLGILEENGYGNPDDCGVLLGFGFQRILRDARDLNERPTYDGGTYAGQSIDPLYGLDRAHSTNLVPTSAKALTFKGTTVSASSIITITTRGTAPLFVGQPISGGNIPAGSVIATLVGTEGAETSLTIGKVEEGNVIVAVKATATEATPEAIEVKRPVGVIVHKPNLHVRIRQDVVLKVSNEASIETGGVTYFLFQDNLTAVLYETRVGIMAHDPARAIIPLYF